MANFEDVGAALQMMGEISGRSISQGAAAMMAQDLSTHSPDAVLLALQRCRQELNRFPTVNDIISRIQARDGRPGVEEAWAMIPKSEDGSVVWTDEMSGAYGLAAPLLKVGDDVGARMAFKEKYSALVREAREADHPVRWTMSPGYDPHGRETAIKEAMRLGRLESTHPLSRELLTAPKKETLYISDESESTPPEEAKAKIQEMLKSITKTIGETQ